MSAAVTSLIREIPLAAPSHGVEVSTPICRVLSNLRAAVMARKVCTLLFSTCCVVLCLLEL